MVLNLGGKRLLKIFCSIKPFKRFPFRAHEPLISPQCIFCPPVEEECEYRHPESEDQDEYDNLVCPVGGGVWCGQLDPPQPGRTVEEAHQKVHTFLLGVILWVAIVTLEIAGFNSHTLCFITSFITVSVSWYLQRKKGKIPIVQPFYRSYWL